MDIEKLKKKKFRIETLIKSYKNKIKVIRAAIKVNEDLLDKLYFKQNSESISQIELDELEDIERELFRQKNCLSNTEINLFYYNNLLNKICIQIAKLEPLKQLS